MTETTPLDAAHAAMQATPDDDAARLRFYERLADAMLFVLLEQEAEGDRIAPEVFEIADERFVLVFDSEARLTAFTGRAAPYAAMPGRAIAALLAQGGLGLGLNLEVAPSAFLLPPSGVAWLAETLADAPEETHQVIARIFAPRDLPESLLAGLETKLATAAGLADCAYLVRVEYAQGATGHLLGFVDALPGAAPALANAISEVLRFSGVAAEVLDVGFFASSEAVVERLARAGLRFDLPRPRVMPAAPRAAPGTDPDKPPILR